MFHTRLQGSWRITRDTNGLSVERVGACPTFVNMTEIDRTTLAAGDTLLLQKQLLLLCVKRPEALDSGFEPDPDHAFGAPDGDGIVGESAQAWALRRDIRSHARADRHLLIHGPSGCGKELVAQALHARSSQRAGPLVARNAATFPEGLIDAELFGSIRDYPNAGMPERPGLIGEADGGTLFLDEIGELPRTLQSHLLRVLDAGEYQRLGSSRPLRANFRLVAATSRPIDNLIPELAARFAIRLEVPTLDARREDIPLIARELLNRAARGDSDFVRQFFDTWDGHRGSARIDPRLIEILLHHNFATNVRELDALLWESMLASRSTFIAPAPRLLKELRSSFPPESGPVPGVAAIRAALVDHLGSITLAAEALGLSSRLRALSHDEEAPHPS